MIALSDNPSIPSSGADDYCPENMSKKLLRSLYVHALQTCTRNASSGYIFKAYHCTPPLLFEVIIYLISGKYKE